jgi:septal ring factor EnvC (AmiA/AmiB activator)
MSEPADTVESSLKLLADMAAVFADPAKLQREITQFQNAKAGAERAQANLAKARAKHDEQIAASTAELDERRSKHVAREIALMQREGRIEASAKIQKEREETLNRRFGVTESVGGLTREFADTAPDRPDPHYGNA